ncbi:uncharacterized protein BX663DRAFT_462965 [Cokeromyces recurvatus]|uniref:uncharacterized protein n=1 Tax=Cokeromyces recurvatus TaxID=90255 RepID=UPI00221FF6E2|nr:uncharacterized protein BX663DRAFT_462965 [Cokeromyces recurvatus]KAI7897850.1 hypothetical protein BX663DRAFT_462965 [Cokeromyces recurvatus]
MSTYANKVSSRKGNNSKKGQAHQNTTAWKANKNSKKTRQIAALPVYGLCQRCTDVILWRKKYKKYKPLTTAKKCTSCQEKAIKEAYHVLCDNCARSKGVCAKCLEKKEVLVTKDEIKTNVDEIKEEQELERMLSRMTLRQRRSYLRKLERGDDVSGIVPKEGESDFDFEDSEFEFDDDEDDEDNEESNDEEENK